ncbi:MAG: ATP-binding cassette domain-containing protein [Clostridiales bacterium]|nr:ATP-binding cassette domain-containing protein [Clostridiales bacterium]
MTVLLNYAEKIFDYFLEFGANLEYIDEFYAISKKIKDLLKLKQEEKNADKYNLDGDIIFSNVTIFADNQEILKNLNFIIKKGEKVAIVGENGSGKSLLSKAILGMNEYTGNIYINNHNIKRLNKNNIREYIDLIQGDSYLFKGSIIENINLNNEIKKNIKSVFKDCEIYDDIQRFKEKENTLIGERGVKLSGGQKQRIAIARSLIKDKPIFIFDEALNKIDNKTKEKILLNLTNNYKDKTMLFINHDLNILKHVDKILYIDNNTTTLEKINGEFFNVGLDNSVNSTFKNENDKTLSYIKKIIEMNEKIGAMDET